MKDRKICMTGLQKMIEVKKARKMSEEMDEAKLEALAMKLAMKNKKK